MQRKPGPFSPLRFRRIIPTASSLRSGAAHGRAPAVVPSAKGFGCPSALPRTARLALPMRAVLGSCRSPASVSCARRQQPGDLYLMLSLERDRWLIPVDTPLARAALSPVRSQDSASGDLCVVIRCAALLWIRPPDGEGCPRAPVEPTRKMSPPSCRFCRVRDTTDLASACIVTAGRVRVQISGNGRASVMKQ
jgi:hypothetical protein